MKEMDNQGEREQFTCLQKSSRTGMIEIFGRTKVGIVRFRY